MAFKTKDSSHHIPIPVNENQQVFFSVKQPRKTFRVFTVNPNRVSFFRRQIILCSLLTIINFKNKYIFHPLTIGVLIDYTLNYLFF